MTNVDAQGPTRAVDHLVFRVPDLEAGMDVIEQRLGVRPAGGGVHPGRGTRNALLGLGEGCYLEVIAPDPAQPETPTSWRFGPPVSAPELSTWAARSDLIETQLELARTRGLDLGAVAPMSRERPDGSVLRWQLTTGERPGDGLVPFLIDWGRSDHPSASAPAGCRLIALRARHPDPERITRLLSALDLALPVEHGDRSALIAEIETPLGRVMLE
ncbi:MAG: VOC family protein [Chloroflexi bacterium]|nr:VOC family protein [Chloroflexota bacterium]MDA1002395.1 VOC family protein [Chloroflexota bacterium]